MCLKPNECGGTVGTGSFLYTALKLVDVIKLLKKLSKSDSPTLGLP
jgi:hypothetical protein